MRSSPLPGREDAGALRTRDQRFGYEAEVIFAAVRAKIPVVEVPVTVVYPPKHKRVTHYRAVKDTLHIVFRITYTILFPTRWLFALVVLLATLVLLHPAVVHFTEMRPPRSPFRARWPSSTPMIPISGPRP